MSKQYHPVHETDSGTFDLANGGQFNLKNPTEDMIDIRDIACALSKICRFGGQIRQFYSVAQHSVYVADLAERNLESKEIQKAALLHDASEAYLFDCIKPLKVMLGHQYQVLEDLITSVIFSKYKVDPDLLKHVKTYDMMALEIEHQYLVKRRPMAFTVDHWLEAEARFNKRFEELFETQEVHHE